MSFFRPEIEAMAGYVPGEQPQDGEFIKLNTNENPYPPSPAVAGRSRRRSARLRKYPDPMAEAFRRRAAELLGVGPDWILCGNGSDDILTIVTRALVGQGQLLRLPYPSYILYKTLGRVAGGAERGSPFQRRLVAAGRVCRRPRRSAAGVSAQSEQPFRHGGSARAGAGNRRALPCPLLVDEAYADFAETNCVSLVARCEKIMVSRSLSKSYALAGLRFGYLVAPAAR